MTDDIADGGHTVVLIGNPNPQMHEDGILAPAEHLNQSVTRIEFVPATFDREKVALSLSTDNDRALVATAARMADEHRDDYALAVHEAESIMATHSAGARPSWVSCPENPDLAEAIGAHFGCPVGEPVALQTTVGRDAMHEQYASNSAQPATFQYGALSASATELKAADTVLAGEITTAEGGLLRAKMTFAHTTGTNVSTLTFTWTANSHDTLSVTLKKWANFNKATSGGTVGNEDELETSATLSAIGDSITVTWKNTAG